MKQGLRYLLLLLFLPAVSHLPAQGNADAHVRQGDTYFSQMAYAGRWRSTRRPRTWAP